jgi:hypothetical protein
VYLRYQQENNASIYQNAPNEDHPFSKLVRLKLIYRMLSAPKRLGGCNLEITSLLHQRKILSVFPLHEHDDCRNVLLRCMHWTTLPWNMPIEQLKEYLGEKIALFSVFLGHSSFWLWPISIIGVACQAVVLVTGNYSHPIVSLYSVVVMIWSIFMLFSWKRNQSEVALRWGMMDFVDQQQERPEFFGELHTNSFIDGREMLYFSAVDFRKRIARSIATVLTLLLMVLGVISAIYVLRFSLQVWFESYV